MKDSRPIATVRRHAESRRQRRTLPVWASVALAAGCSLVAYYVGDAVGFSRGAETRHCDEKDPIAQLDAAAARHKERAEHLRRDAGVTPPVQYSFHDTLKGAPRPPMESPVPPPPPPPLKPHVDPKPVIPTAEPARIPADVPKAPPPEPTKNDLPRAPESSQPAPPETIKPNDTVRPADAEPLGNDANPPAAAKTPGPSTTTLLQPPSAAELALQAGPYSEKAEALAVFDKLRAAGLRPAIVPLEQGGSTTYRIRVGRFPDQASAQSAAKALSERSGIHTVVVKH